MPAQIIFVTDGDTLSTLVAMAKLPENPVTGVYYASSLLPHKMLSSHTGLYGPDGKPSKANIYSTTGLDLSALKGGPGLFSKDYLTEPAVLKAWFMLACGEWSALPQIANHAKTKGTSGEQAKMLVERVEAALTERVKKVQDKSSLAMVDLMEAERVCSVLEQLPTQRDTLKGLQTKMQAAAKETALKDEIIARSAYLKIVPMLLTKRKPEAQDAKSYFEQIVKKFGETEYGKRSANAVNAITTELLSVNP